MRLIWILVLVLAVAAVACSSKISGEIEINGEKAGLSSCRNGVVFGYRGVELTTQNGDRLRIASSQTGEAWLVVMASGAATGNEIGTCGTFEISDQNSTINDVKNVKGQANLECATADFKVKGTVTFENCH